MEQESGITVQDLKEHILKHMSAEEALEKLLTPVVGQYEKLKVDPEYQGHPLFIIAAAVVDLGWDFILEKETEENRGMMRGVCVGTEEFLDTVFKNKSDGTPETED